MKVHLPWKNLGCLGFTIGRLYFDIYRTDYFPFFAVFINTGRAKFRWSFHKGFRETDI